MKVEEEIQKLVEAIQRLGSVLLQVTFGVLVNDNRRANIFEALVETLIAAKKRNIVEFLGELLSDDDIQHIEITLPLPPLGLAATS